MELFRSMAVLAEPPGADTARLCSLLELPTPEPWQYTELFLEQLYPYASVYLDGEGQLGGEARDRVAGFWRALGEAPPAEPDHLAVLLAAYARLGDLERDSPRTQGLAWRRARSALLWEHLLSWLPLWLRKLEDIAGTGYREWGALLAEAVAAEAAGMELPPELPLHLREAPSLADPRQVGGERFVAELLSPVRAGFIVTRSDLVQGGRRSGLGVRMGERAYALKALLAHDQDAALRLLEELASAAAQPWDTGQIAAFWSARAGRTADCLQAIRRSEGFPKQNRNKSGEN